MTDVQIKNIIDLRWAVYRLGASYGRWEALSDDDVKGFMEFLFPKSKNLAAYNLMRNIVMSSESIKSIPAGCYNLFKFPEQIEEEILNYQKKNLDIDFSVAEEYAESVLDSLATVVSDSDLFSSSIGTLDENGLDNTIAILAYRYRASLKHNTDNNPYFQ